MVISKKFSKLCVSSAVLLPVHPCFLASSKKQQIEWFKKKKEETQLKLSIQDNRQWVKKELRKKKEKKEQAHTHKQ